MSSSDDEDNLFSAHDTDSVETDLETDTDVSTDSNADEFELFNRQAARAIPEMAEDSMNAPKFLGVSDAHNCDRHIRTAGRGNLKNCPHCPLPRSGHRVFCTADHLYVVGGYNGYIYRPGSSMTVTDMWAMNLVTREWTPVNLSQPLPDTMASFSLTNVRELNTFYIYGGTGVPFGETVSNSLYECRFRSDFEVDVRKVQLLGDESPKIYGQSTVYRLDYNKRPEIYVLGGTVGHEYHMHVFRFQFVEEGVARCKRVSRQPNEPQDRYRHESVIHDSHIYSVGGTDLNNACAMNQLDVFDISLNSFRQLPVEADPEQGYPVGRKGHALVLDAHTAYMFGGVIPAPQPQSETLLKDVWALELDRMRWRRVMANMPKPVFFHSADVTKDHQVLSFGGCYTVLPNPLRTQDVCTFFTRAPPLGLQALNYLAARNPRQLTHANAIRRSLPLNTVRRLVLSEADYEQQHELPDAKDVRAEVQEDLD